MAALAVSILHVSADETNSLRLIRSATLKIDYAGSTILIDPMLSAKGELKSVLGVNRNPTVHLTMSPEEVVQDVDFVMASHSHFDHIDKAACDLMKKDSIVLYIQPEDTAAIRKKFDYKPTSILLDSMTVNGITIFRTRGQHGNGELKDKMGAVSGFILKAPNAPTLYIVGDCLWTDEIKGNIEKYHPDYVIVNSGGAINPKLSPTLGAILMNEKDVVDMIKSTPTATKFVAVHMESLDHCQTTRSILRNEADHSGISKTQLIIPADGETIRLD